MQKLAALARSPDPPTPLSSEQAYRKRPAYVYRQDGVDGEEWRHAPAHTWGVHLLVLVEEGDHVRAVGRLLEADESHVRTWVPDR